MQKACGRPFRIRCCASAADAWAFRLFPQPVRFSADAVQDGQPFSADVLHALHCAAGAPDVRYVLRQDAADEPDAPDEPLHALYALHAPDVRQYGAQDVPRCAPDCVCALRQDAASVPPDVPRQPADGAAVQDAAGVLLRSPPVRIPLHEKPDGTAANGCARCSPDGVSHCFSERNQCARVCAVLLLQFHLRRKAFGGLPNQFLSESHQVLHLRQALRLSYGFHDPLFQLPPSVRIPVRPASRSAFCADRTARNKP